MKTAAIDRVNTPLNNQGKPRKRSYTPTRALSCLETPDGAPPKRLKLYLGPPRKFQNAQEFWELACQYFRSCCDPVTDEIVEPILITGLCNYLGTWRERLNDWLSGVRPDNLGDNGDSSGLPIMIKRCKSLCESYAEHHCYTARNPAGGIFVLKNYGWSDNLRIEHQISIEHSISPETRGILDSYMTHLKSSLMSDEGGGVVDAEFSEETETKLLEP